MLNTILGTKVKMTQAFVDNTRVPVTVVSVTPNVVTQIITEDKNGYSAVQLGTGEKKLKNTSKPLQGHLKKANLKNEKTTLRHLREVKVDQVPEIKVGDTIKVSDVLSAGDTVTITGVSKGKGFAGAIKRHGFSGGPKTHGQSDRHRAPGSIGQGTSPGRVWKGKRMAGRMGMDTVTLKNIQVIAVDDEKNELHVKSPLPGAPKSLLIIKRTSPMQVKPVEESVAEEVSVDTEAVANEESEVTNES